MFHQQAKDLEGAQELYQVVVSGWLAQLGPKHAHTLHARYGLALVLRERGLKAEARVCCVEGVEGYTEAYGSLHPMTITVKRVADTLR